MLYKHYNVPCGTIDRYIELLLNWNKRINLVSVANKKELIDRHILDSLQLVDYVDKDSIIVDIGSGAGFPGLMLSYAGIRNIHLVEKIAKKASFLMVASTLSLNNVIVHNCAAEELKLQQCDIITARGLASLDVIFTITKHICSAHTRYILPKGKNFESEIKNTLEKWEFKYIIHPSKTSNEGYILEVEQLRQR